MNFRVLEIDALVSCVVMRLCVSLLVDFVIVMKLRVNCRNFIDFSDEWFDSWLRKVCDGGNECQMPCLWFLWNLVWKFLCVMCFFFVYYVGRVNMFVV